MESKFEDIHREDDKGLTALHRAVEEKDLMLVSHLLSLGADPSHKDKRDQTPLHKALCLENTLLVVLELLNCGSDVNACDVYGKTPLFYAVESGVTEKVSVEPVSMP